MMMKRSYQKILFLLEILKYVTCNITDIVSITKSPPATANISVLENEVTASEAPMIEILSP